MMLLVQDCVCVIAPYPFRIEQLEDFDPPGDLDVTRGGDVWYARPLLFFTCNVCPNGQMGDTALHKDVLLILFNSLEPISLTPESCMQEGRSNAVRKGGFSGAIALCLPSGKHPWTGASDSMLPERQLSQYNQLQGEDPKGSCSRFKIWQRDWEPAFRNQHVDVALWKDLSSSNLCGSSCEIAQKEGVGIQGTWH
jgi:hypothetical protein